MEQYAVYAMQYKVSLPADYDMQIIRRRVASRGHFLDAYPGLGVKAYLMRERGVGGAGINEYAPFYLWSSATGMGRFLWEGGGFGALVADFGRPTVHHWTGVRFCKGPAVAPAPHVASIGFRYLADDVNPQEAVQEALARLQARSLQDGVHSTALAIDPRCWQLVQFTLWEHISGDPSETAYEVLHFSNPDMNNLPFHLEREDV